MKIGQLRYLELNTDWCDYCRTLGTHTFATVRTKEQEEVICKACVAFIKGGHPRGFRIVTKGYRLEAMWEASPVHGNVRGIRHGRLKGGCVTWVFAPTSVTNAYSIMQKLSASLEGLHDIRGQFPRIGGRKSWKGQVSEFQVRLGEHE